MNLGTPLRTFLVLLSLSITAPGEPPDDPQTMASAPASAVAATNVPPDRRAIRQELGELSKEERAKWLKAYREQYGTPDSRKLPGGKTPNSIAQWREMSPEERASYLGSLRGSAPAPDSSAEQQTERVQRAWENIRRQIQVLETKRRAGTLTEHESRFLDQLLQQQKKVRARANAITTPYQTRSKPPEPTGVRGRD